MINIHKYLPKKVWTTKKQPPKKVLSVKPWTPSPKERALLEMKTVAKLHKIGLCPTIVDKVIQEIRMQPFAKHDEEAKQVIALEGFNIEVGATFRQGTPSPILKDYHITLTAHHPGFPRHPLEHTGFVLSHALLPPFPLKPFPYLEELLHKKNALAIALLPRGQYHNALKPIEPLSSLPLFYRTLFGPNLPEDPIEAMHHYNKTVIEQPANLLRSHCPELHQLPREERSTKALEILQSALPANSPFPFLPAIHEILLQQYSELGRYPAPPLSPLAQKLQALAHTQLLAFLSRFTSPFNPTAQLEQELQLLHSPTTDPFVAQLKAYYCST